MKTDKTNAANVVYMNQLQPDLRRMLTVQIKELVNHIEDTEYEQTLEKAHNLFSGGKYSGGKWISGYDRFKHAS